VKLYDCIKQLMALAKSRNIKVHLGYLEYNELLKELYKYASVVVSTSRCAEAAPLYVIEAFTLGSLVITLRKPYGPYEYALKILSNVSKELRESYIDTADKLYKFFVSQDSSKLIDTIFRTINAYFDNNIYVKARNIAVDIIKRNIDKAVKVAVS